MRARLPTLVACLCVASGAWAADPQVVADPDATPLETVESGVPTGLDTVAFSLDQAPTGPATTSGPLITEYVEGSSNNKALEIHNGTGADIDLGSYEIREVYNGGSSTTTIPLGPGTLPDGATWVLTHAAADTVLLDLADQTSTSLRFNGNDFVGLYDTAAHAYVDGIGQIDVDPGSAWGTEPLTTANHTLRRKTGVCTGHTPADTPFEPVLVAEWTGWPSDTFDDLGQYTSSCPSVVLTLSTDDPSEGTVQPDQLIFSSTDFDIPQTVQVVGVDDTVIDGDIDYEVQAVASGAPFDGVTAQVPAVNHDDDAPPGAVVTPEGPLYTGEDGTAVQVEVRLAAPPVADVTGTASSLDPSEGVAAQGALVFSPTDWFVPRPLTVAGVDDLVDDGDVAYQVALAWSGADPGYDGLPDTSIDLVNVDDDTAGVDYPYDALDLAEGGSASLQVVLLTEPADPVQIDLTVDPPDAATPSPARLQFTSEDWDTPQTVVVRGTDDAVVNPDRPFLLRLDPFASQDAVYAELGLDPVSGTVRNDDHAGIQVEPTSLRVQEGGAAAQYTVRLDSQPTAAVVIPIASSDLGEVTVDPATLVLDASDWQGATVTVTPVDDAAVDGSQVVTLTQGPTGSTDSTYAGLAVPSVTVTNDDDDVADLVVIGPSDTELDEGGSTTLHVALGSAPSSDVIVQLASSDPVRVQVAPGSLTLSSLDWQTPRTVTVSVAQDTKVQGDEQVAITLRLSTMDPSYSALPSRSVDLLIHDDDQPRGNCGCSTGGSGGAGLWLLLLALVRRRRPRHISG